MTKKTDSFWITAVKLQLKHRVLIALLMTIITSIAFYTIITKLKVGTDFFEFYPPQHPYIQVYKEFRKMFGSANVLTIILERKGEGDIYNPETLKKVKDLTLGVLKIEGCSPIQVSSIAHPNVKQIVLTVFGIGMFPLMYPDVPKNLAECEKFKETVYSTKGVRGFYVSMDDKTTVVFAGFWEEGVSLPKLFKKINALTASIEDENHACFVAGYPMLYAWVNYYLPQIYLILCVTAIAMILLLIIYFRRIDGVIIPIISGIISAVWGLGFAAMMGINIDPLLLVVPVLLSARAMSHSCQCIERFSQEFSIHKDRKRAIINAYSSLYPPALLAIITDGFGVLAISISTIPLMQKLAFFSSFWLISIVVSVMILNPIILSFFYSMPLANNNSFTEKEIVESTLSKKTPYAILINAFLFLSGRKTKWICSIMAILFIFLGGLISTRYLKVGDSSANGAILYPDHPYNIAQNKMNADFAGASQLVVVIEGKEKGAIKDRNSLITMANLSHFMTQNIEDIGATLCLSDIVRKVYRTYHEGYPKWDMIPQSKKDLAQIFWNLSSSMVPGEMDQYVSLPDYTDSNVRAYMRAYNHESIKEAIDQIKKYQETLDSDPDSKITIRLAGGILGILAAINEEVEWSYWAILIVIFSTTFILCTVTYRSFKAAIILLVPLAVSQILCELIMLLFKIDLNISSLPVAAIGVGVGIDYGIYLLSRLKEECYIQNDFDKARLIALITTGKVIMFTALTLGLGVGFWIFATMKFSAEMGLLILLLMIFNMTSALVLVPSLTAILKPDFVKQLEKSSAS